MDSSLSLRMTFFLITYFVTLPIFYLFILILKNASRFARYGLSNSNSHFSQKARG